MNRLLFNLRNMFTYAMNCFQPPCFPFSVIVSSQPQPEKEDLFWKMLVQNNVKYMVALEVTYTYNNF